jgi:hypothetical protein
MHISLLLINFLGRIIVLHSPQEGIRLRLPRQIEPGTLQTGFTRLHDLSKALQTLRVNFRKRIPGLLHMSDVRIDGFDRIRSTSGGRRLEEEGVDLKVLEF